MMNQVPASGLDGFVITVSVADPTIATSTAVTPSTWGSIKGNGSDFPGYVWIKALVPGAISPGATNSFFGTITISEIKAGTTSISIVPTEIDASNGDLITSLIFQR